MVKKKGTVKEVSAADLRRRINKKTEEAPAGSTEGAREAKPAGEGEDRRGSARLDTRLEIEVPLASWEQFRRVYTKNISKGGMLFSVSSPAKMPGALTLTLALPDGRKVALTAEVRHVAPTDNPKEFDVGVQFQDLGEASQAVLDQIYAGLAGKA